jgi:hypothetical protein
VAGGGGADWLLRRAETACAGEGAGEAREVDWLAGNEPRAEECRELVSHFAMTRIGGEIFGQW